MNGAMLSSKSMEHYTPRHIIDAVCKIWPEGIDLDPCCNPGEPVVPARQHYRLADNGLLLPWEGRAFINPPYGRQIEHWVNHGLRQPAEQIWLVPARTDTFWFRALVSDAEVWCAIRGRLVFGGNTDPAPFPSAVVYVAPTCAMARDLWFMQQFAPLGSLFKEAHP